MADPASRADAVQAADAVPAAGAGPDRPPFDVTAAGVVLRVHVQPGARRAGLAGRHGDAVKLRVAAPAVDGRANTAVCQALADLFGLRPAQVTLVAGTTARAKRVLLAGVDAAAATAVLGAAHAL